MRRNVNSVDLEWFQSHQNLCKIATDELKSYGVIHYYRIPEAQEEKHFCGNFILLFENSMLEDWSVADIQALHSLIQ